MKKQKTNKRNVSLILPAVVVILAGFLTISSVASLVGIRSDFNENIKKTCQKIDDVNDRSVCNHVVLNQYKQNEASYLILSVLGISNFLLFIYIILEKH